MNVRMIILIAVAPMLFAPEIATAERQPLNYGARREPALGRVSPAPSIFSRHAPQAAAPRYYGGRERVCWIRTVRERYGDRIVERRYKVCRER